MFCSYVSILLMINVQMKGYKAFSLTEIDFTGGAALIGFHTPFVVQSSSSL
uniref:Uncharacterized protein n=1 Tax=Arion vulgaris TaxID=1028688 RepID=A0A0B7BN39_9EUPU